MRLLQGGERASVVYLHNALGQRVFKSAPEFDFHAPREDQLGMPFVGWLRRQYGWLFTPDARGHARLGEAFVYGDGEVPAWALLGSYDNGTVQAHGRSEFIWLPTEDGGAIPIGLYRNDRLYAVQSDHLGTPRVITDQRNQPVWQWPYSGFGDTQPVGVLKAGDKDLATVLKGRKPLVEVNLRFPGQYFDEEAGLTYNLMRSYDQRNGRYSQADPIGLEGGLNRFAYARLDPIGSSDPTGLCPFCLPLITGGIGAVTGGYAAYASGGNVWVGAGIGFLGGATAGLPAATLFGTVGYGLLGGAIGGAAGDVSSGNVPSAKSVAFGAVLGVVAAPLGPMAKPVLGSEAAGVAIGGTLTGITDLANSSFSARRDNLKLLQCPAR